MNGREEWAKFAEDNSIAWVTGKPMRFDQYGTEYSTYIWPVMDNAKLLKYLHGDTFVVVRTFPQVENGLVRMRLASYPKKPEQP